MTKTLQKKSALLTWNLMGAFSCLLFYFLYPIANFNTVSILSLILGFSIGLGIPSCLALFANQSKTEKRGRLGAVVFFTIQILSALILLPISAETIAFQFLIIAIWRLVGLGGFLIYKPVERKPEERKTSLVSIIRERKFILLFLPWFMFTLINYIETPVLEISMGSFYTTYTIVGLMIISIAAIPAGILCDLKGRKITGILGFIFLGLGYAVLSIFAERLEFGAFPYIFFMILDGVAWGLLYVNFVFVIWGDLSEGSSREKYYVLGGLPFLLAGLIQVLVQPFAHTIADNITLSFTLASFFLFVAMLPLVFAPESLSDKIMKSRELNTYIQKALLTADRKKADKKKQTQETENKESDQPNNENGENKEETDNDKKARELAEKYY